LGSVVFAFLLIMTAGGFIAYFGDRLGYVMGKKRVTLFGMRPRHTATTLTVIAGVLIGGFTLAFLIGVNSAFRIALLKGEAQIRENIRLKKSNAHLRIVADQDEAAASKAQLAAAAAVQAASDAQVAAQSAVVQKQNADAGLAAAKKQLGQEQLKLTSKQAELTNLTATLNGEQRQLAEIRTDVQLEQQDLNKTTLVLKKDLVFRRSASLIYRDQGEVGRAAILATETPVEIRADLVLFLDKISQTAKDRGAKVGSNGRSVVIESIELVDPKPQDSGVLADENDSLDALTSQIHSYGAGSVAVVARAAGNSFVGDQVIIGLRPYSDVLALHAGQQIAQTVITGGTSNVNEIAAELQLFLVNQVRPAAERAGVIPVTNPLTGAQELGDITLQQIYDIVSQIRQLNGPAVVSASVDSDVYSADQLKLKFSVRAGAVGN